ncbi:MAG TPA: DUF6587 family protein [Telluria sp.]
MIQELAVGAIVAVAALYAGAKYLPAAWRRRIVFALSGGAAESRLARLLGTESSCASGCDSCKACATPEAPLTGVPGAAAPGAAARRVIKLHHKP